MRANTRTEGIGGHLSTYASSAALYEVGFNHFFRGKADGGFGDQVFFQGHASPGIYARAYVEGRLSEARARQLPPRGGRRRPARATRTPGSLPDFWEFPTVSMGLGPIAAIYQAHVNRYLQPAPPRRHQRRAGSGASSATARWTSPSPSARSGVAGREHLDNLIFVVNCNLQRLDGPGPGQRQDHPGARGGVPRRRVERDQGDLGLALGRAARPGRRRRPARPHEHHGRRRVPEAGHRVGGLHPGALLRPRPAPARDGRGPQRRRARLAPPRRPRLPQALRRLQAGDRAAGRARPSSWPRPSRGGRSAPRSRPATPPTRSRR